MYSNTISLRYFFPRARILNEIAEFEKMPLNRKTLIRQNNRHARGFFFVCLTSMSTKKNKT